MDLSSDIIRIFNSSQLNKVNDAIKMLLEIGKKMSADEGDLFIDKNPELLKYKDIASKLYQTYIVEAEDQEVKKLLQYEIDDNFSISNYFGNFGKQAYDRVHDMFKYVNYEQCQRFVLVGCGSLPVTMFRVHDQTEVPEIIGLDSRLGAIKKFEFVLDRYNLKRMRSINCSGQDFDYSGADIVYVANLVSPKEMVLKRIIETAPENVQIILRDPYSIGRLWTERGNNKLDTSIEVLAIGEPGPAYFSRDVFLKKRG